MARLRRRMRFEQLENRSLLAATIGIADVVLDADSPGGQVVASLEIDNAAGLRAAAVEIQYDQHLMQPDLASVRAGSIWDGKGMAIANVNNQAGTITAFIFATQDMGLSSGSLLDIDFSFNEQAAGNVRANIGVGSLRLNEGEMPVSPLPIDGQAAINGSITRKETSASNRSAKSPGLSEQAKLAAAPQPVPRDQPSSLESVGAAMRPSVVRPPTVQVAKATGHDTAARPPQHWAMIKRLPQPTPATQPSRVLPAVMPVVPLQKSPQQQPNTYQVAKPQPSNPASQIPSPRVEQKDALQRETLQQPRRSSASNPDALSIGHGNPDALSARHVDLDALSARHEVLQLDASMFIGPMLSLAGDHSPHAAFSAAGEANATGGQADESTVLEPSQGPSDGGVGLKSKSLGPIADFTGRLAAARKDSASAIAPQGPRRAPIGLPSIGLLGSRRESASPVDPAVDDEGDDPIEA